MRFLLVYHPAIEKSRKSKQIAEQVAQQLRKLGEAEACIISVDDLQHITPADFDMVLTFGGDGTIIHTAAHFVETQTPLLGVNLGTVGFLSSLELNELVQALPKLIAGDYELEKRSVLEVQINEQERYYCVNELCIKSPKAHMIQFYVMIDGELHSYFKGDGMLLATPTGSTAYALSAGGPVIDPELEVILLTPLVSYLLSKKPLVISGKREICLYSCIEQETMLAVDGQLTHLLQGKFRIRLRQAQHMIQLVNVKKRRFFASVEKRLGQTAAPDNEKYWMNEPKTDAISENTEEKHEKS